MIDEKLNFNEHATDFCNKASKKIQQELEFLLEENSKKLTRRKILMNVYLLFQFGYYPSVWMNHKVKYLIIV